MVPRSGKDDSSRLYITMIQVMPNAASHREKNAG